MRRAQRVPPRRLETIAYGLSSLHQEGGKLRIERRVVPPPGILTRKRPHRNKPATLLDKLSPRLVRLPSARTSSQRGNPPTESAGFGGSRLHRRGYPGTGDVGRVSTSANMPFSASASPRASCRSGVPPKSTCSAVTRSSMSATGSHAAQPGGPFLRASVAFVAVVVVAVVVRRAGVASPLSESEASESDVGGVCERIVASERMPRRGRGAARSAGRDVLGDGDREEDSGGDRVENTGGERDEDGGGEHDEESGGGEREAFTGGDFRLRGVVPHPAGEKDASDSSKSGERESMGSDADGL